MKQFSTLLLASTVSILVTGCMDTSTDDTFSIDTSVRLSQGVSALPQQMSVVPPTSTDNAAGPLTRAAQDAGTDYSNTEQNIYVGLDAVEPISFIDDLLCFVNQAKPLEFANSGAYISWQNADRCFEEKEGDEQQEGTEDNSVSYVPVVVQATRESDTSPLVMKSWIDDFGDNEGPDAIKMLGTVSQQPTAENPFGAFMLTYGLLPAITGTEADSTGEGEVDAFISDNIASFTLYQDDNHDWDGFNVNCLVKASVDYTESTESGVARISRNCSSDNAELDSNLPKQAFALAVNSNNIAISHAPTMADLNTDTPMACLSRTDVTENVWDYALFDADTGAKVDITSGVSVRLADNSWGHIGYWGAWKEGDLPYTNGEQVTEHVWDDLQIARDFTVNVAPGRLIKLNVETLPLSNLESLRFNTWLDEGQYSIDLNEDGTIGNWSGDTVVEYNTTDFSWQANALMDYDLDGEWSENSLVTPVAFVVDPNSELHLWSQQLGGEVKFRGGQNNVIFFANSFVDGSELAGDLNLNCYGECTKAGLVAADLNASPFDDAGAPVAYVFNQSTLTLTRGGADVVSTGISAAEFDLASNYNWGVRSGALIPDTVTVVGPEDLHNGTITEFYVWEIGPNPWQQQVSLIDNFDNSIVEFDRPISFTYTHLLANDRNADNSQSDKIFKLEYGGYGNLWGLPHVETQGDSGNSHWYPLISLADGTQLTDSNANVYVVKALNVEQRMATALPGACANLPLTAPHMAMPTGITQDVFNIGDMPTPVSEEPLVIDGELVSSL